MTDFDNLTYLHGKPLGSGMLKASLSWYEFLKTAAIPGLWPMRWQNSSKFMPAR